MTLHNDAPSRRDVIAGAMGAGFALAVRPVAASTIRTSADGLDAGDITIASGTGAIPGYRAMPARPKGKLPVVLVVHEIFGVHEHIKDVCRRLAKLGYFALAPDLFVRQGDVSKMSDFQEIRSKVLSHLPDAQVVSDLDAARAWANASGAADATRLAITGFCWGGRITWLYAAHNAALKAAVAWYGHLEGERDALHPRQPVDVAAELKAPVLGLYGGKDQGITQTAVEHMRAALAAGGKIAAQSEIKVYPDAGHAFFADYRPSYRADAAADAWNRMLAWFRSHGV